MQAALRKFAVDDSSVSPYIYHRLLGHVDVDELIFRHIHLPKQLSAPNLPTLNNSQVRMPPGVAAASGAVCKK